MKLKEIHIKNFRGIKNQKIESIEDALILIGKNNAGKSAFLAAIKLCLATIYLRIRIYIMVVMNSKLMPY